MDDHRHSTQTDRVLNVRKLAAIDLALHGNRFILAEFALGIILCAAVGLSILVPPVLSGRTLSTGQIVIGGEFLAIALSYIALLLLALDLIRRGSARAEVAAELANHQLIVRRYGVQQVLILVPLAVPLLALAQQVRRPSR